MLGSAGRATFAKKTKPKTINNWPPRRVKRRDAYVVQHKTPPVDSPEGPDIESKISVDKKFSQNALSFANSPHFYSVFVAKEAFYEHVPFQLKSTICGTHSVIIKKSFAHFGALAPFLRICSSYCVLHKKTKIDEEEDRKLPTEKTNKKQDQHKEEREEANNVYMMKKEQKEIQTNNKKTKMTITTTRNTNMITNAAII